MANNLKLWINAETGRLLSSGSSFISSSSPTFHAGDTISLELHLLAGAGVARAPYEIPFPAGASVKVAVGTVAKNPLGGEWRLSVSSTETSDLPYNASASAVQTALNALSAVSTAGGVVVASLGGGYSITWNTVGTKPSILAGSDTLTPSSYESILVLQAGDVSTREIVFVELRQTPLALATTFAPIGSPSVATSIVSGWNGVNQVIRVNLINSPKSGFWTLTLVRGTNTYISAIRVGASSGDVRTAITSSLSGSVDAGQVGSVNQTDQNQYDIVLTKNFTASVDGTGLIASDALVGDISFATSELIAFLGNLASDSASLEVSVESAGNNAVLVQVGCIVANAVVASGAVAPVSVGTILTETVANARFIRKDLVDAPSTATQDILWQNLGVTTDGSDTVAAINASSSPAAGNPFVTLSELPDLSPYLLVTTAASTYQTIAGMSSYLTTASAASTYETITHASSTYQTISGMSSYLTTATAASTYALLSSFDQSLKTTDSPSFVSITAPVSSGGASPVILNSSGITFSDSTLQTTAFINDGTATWSATSIDLNDFFAGTLNISAATGITFTDSTVQNTRVVREIQANGSGFSTGGFDTAHYPSEVKVIDDTGTAYWVPARLA